MKAKLITKTHSNIQNIISIALILAFLFIIYYFKKIVLFELDTDFSRDLSELSNLWQRQIVWLGPHLSPGFPASPLYYYLYFPFLVIGQGNPYSIIFGNIVIAFVTITYFVLLAVRKKNDNLLLILSLLTLGLSPLIVITATHPGNGYSYFFFLFAGLVGTYFKFPFLFNSLFIGTAISFHPAAVVALPILLYEGYRIPQKLINTLILIFGMLLPWGPIILFEVITSGYLTREWLNHSSSGISFLPNLANVTKLSELFGLPLILAALLWILLFTITRGSLRIWYWVTTVWIILCSLISPTPTHYLFGLAALVLFVATLSIINSKYAITVLGVASFFYLLAILTIQNSLPERPLSKIKNIAETVSTTNMVNQNKKIAVVAALPTGTFVPQADDYRFFLRLKGYQVLGVQQYSQADQLVLFVEQPNFDWKNWSNWEIQSFGEKELLRTESIDGVTIVIYDKK
jgi:hypothetical protein